MKKAMLIVLAILVMAAMAAAQDSTTTPTTAAPNTNWLNADGNNGHISHGCMLCHAPHSAGASISSAAVTPICFPGGGACWGSPTQPFDPGNFPTGYGGPVIGSIVTGNSGGTVAGSIYLWGTALSAQTYTTWDGHTINQSNITAGKGSAVVHTLLCMSCHDNANSAWGMGAGFGQAPGTELGTGNTVTDAYNDHIGLSTINNTGTGWNAASSLTNSHPVDVAYTSGGHNWLINADGTFQDATFNLDGTNLGHPAKLWVDATTNAAMVECTSCHDPHRETQFAYWNGTKYVIGAAGSTTFYLRGPYSDPTVAAGNSGIINANFCRSCHYSKSEMYANNNGGAK